MNKEEILAMSAGEELDHLVMKEIFEASMKYYGEDEIWYHYDSSGEPDYEWSCYNSPSTNISAAWEVVEKLKSIEKRTSRNRPISVIEVGGYSSAKFIWQCRLKDLVNEIQVEAATAPEAISKAALLAVME